MIRRVLCYYIVDFFAEISFFVFVHAMFEEVIAIILSHGSKFFADKTDMLLIPIGFSDPIKENRKKFFKNNIESIIFFFFTVYESEHFVSGIIWIEEKSVVCSVGTVV